MFDRLSMLAGAGVVAAGMSAAMLTGAGTAVALTDGSSGADTSSADAAPSARTESDENGTDETGTDETGTDETGTDEAGTEEGGEPDADTVADEPEAEAPEFDEDAAEPDVAAEVDASEEEGSDTSSGAEPVADGSDISGQPGTTVEDPAPVTEFADESVEPEAEESPADETTEEVTGTATSAEPVDLGTDDAAPAAVADAPPTTEIATMAMTAADVDASSRAAVPARQTLLSLLGTIVFNIYGGLIRVFGGPPQLPRNSTVTVRSSTLEIDCGEGYQVPADWYVPAGVTPERLVYLQHGFLAAGSFYSHTAAHLAESTNSIVVTTSLTSNFLACDGCWLGGSPMHRAVAALFVDGNTALAASALAAGYSSTLLDGVDKVALTGHSAGGGLVAGTAGYMVGNGSGDRLAGVVMLDGVGFGPVLPDALAKLPDDVPIYNLAGRSYFWNLSGSSNKALADARPGEFVGVRLIDGLHSDTMLGGNPLVQFSLYLVTGFSREQNIDASEILNAAWLNDMFDGARTSPYYGQPGEVLAIETPRGVATAYVTPGPAERLSIVDHVFTFFANIVFGIDFATCADEPAEISPISASDTLLSLDGRAKPGQSIGQHVCTG